MGGEVEAFQRAQEALWKFAAKLLDSVIELSSNSVYNRGVHFYVPISENATPVIPGFPAPSLI